MHDDHTVGVRVDVDSYIEWEIDAAHTAEEAREAAVVNAVVEMAERMKEDPHGFGTVEQYWSPE